MQQSRAAAADYSLFCAVPDGSTLQIDCHRVGDRFAHTVRRLGSDRVCVAQWTGVDQGELEQWPASPPVQELSIERIGERDVMLGVGRAGKCHWSLSIETIITEAAAALRFDVACRCPEPPLWLGSTYRVEAVDADGHGDQSADALLRLRCDDDAAVHDGGPGHLRVQPVDRPNKWPGTIRWRYSILGCVGD